MITYYVDHRTLMMNLCLTSANAIALAKSGVRTVDSFQRAQASICLIDLVMGYLTDPARKRPKPGDLMAQSMANTLTQGQLSAHVRDHHRLCCAITRGMDGVALNKFWSDQTRQ